MFFTAKSIVHFSEPFFEVLTDFVVNLEKMDRQAQSVRQVQLGHLATKVSLRTLMLFLVHQVIQVTRARGVRLATQVCFKPLCCFILFEENQDYFPFYIVFFVEINYSVLVQITTTVSWVYCSCLFEICID